MTTSAALTPTTTSSLRRLYLLRFGFAVVWAALVLAAGPDIGPFVGTLIVLYPAFDLAAALVDLRSSRSTRAAQGLSVNIALSAATTVGLVFAAASGTPAVLRVWGAWAVTAGLVQLVVALRRRDLGGQLPMILSGGISVLAGSAFVAKASSADAEISGLAGYATLGGVFFLVAALRLGRTSRPAASN